MTRVITGGEAQVVGVDYQIDVRTDSAYRL